MLHSLLWLRGCPFVVSSHQYEVQTVQSQSLFGCFFSTEWKLAHRKKLTEKLADAGSCSTVEILSKLTCPQSSLMRNMLHVGAHKRRLGMSPEAIRVPDYTASADSWNSCRRLLVAHAVLHFSAQHNIRLPVPGSQIQEKKCQNDNGQRQKAVNDHSTVHRYRGASRLDYQPLFGKMSSRSSREGRNKDQTQESGGNRA